MRLHTFVGLGLSAAVAVFSASCNPPAQPAYADISYQTRCIHADGSPIVGCATPPARDIYGFSGDMGQRFSCTIAERASTRTVNFTVTARSGTQNIGVALSGATVPVGGGPVSTTCTFNWTDGNTYGGNCGASAPHDGQPCQVSNISFTTDTATGLPLMDVNVLCLDAPSIPTMSPEQTRSVTRAGSDPGDDMSAFTIHFYSCPVIQGH
jgi:hypothetical protein